LAIFGARSTFNRVKTRSHETNAADRMIYTPLLPTPGW